MYLEIAFEAFYHQFTHATAAQQVLVGHGVIVIVLGVHALQLLGQWQAQRTYIWEKKLNVNFTVKW